MKPSPALSALAVAGAILVSGCAGALMDTRQPSKRQTTQKSFRPELPNAADPDYQQVYARYRDEMRSRPVIGPGYKGDGVRHAGFTEGVASVTDSITSTVSKGFSKVGAAVKPDEKVNKAVEATSVFNNAKASPDLYVAMAKLHEQSGKLEEAAGEYEKALELAPVNLGALLGYAHLKDRTGDFDSAAQLYQQAAAAFPGEAAVFNDMGLCYARNGKLNEAAGVLAHAAKLQPKKPLYRNNLAIVLVETGQADLAFLHLSAVQPEAVARYNLGQLMLRKGEREAAAQQFIQALKADPTQAESRAWLAELIRSGVTPQMPVAHTASRPRPMVTTPPPVPPARQPAPVRPVANPPVRPTPTAQKPSSSNPPPQDLRERYGNYPVPPGRRYMNARGAVNRSQTPPASTPAPIRRKSFVPEPQYGGAGPPMRPQSPAPAMGFPVPAPGPNATAPGPEMLVPRVNPRHPSGGSAAGPLLQVPSQGPALVPAIPTAPQPGTRIEHLPPVPVAPMPGQ